MNSKKLKAERARLLQVAKDILAKCDKENREMTEDEQAEHRSSLDKISELNDQIKQAEHDEKLLADAQAAVDAEQKPRRKTVPSEQSQRELNEINDTSQISGGHLVARDDPKRGFKSHTEFLNRAFDAAQNGKHDFDPRLKYLNTPNEDASRDRVKQFMQAVGSDEQGGYADPYGGFLIPEGFMPELLKIDPEADPVAGRTTGVPMQTPVVRIPARVDKNHSTSVAGGLTVGRKAEVVAANSSRMQLEQVVLEAHSLFGLSYITEELMQDSPISFMALLAAGFGDAFSGEILNERLRGTGVGEYLGILNSPAKIEVAKESMQAADTIVYENVVKVRSRAWKYENCVWLANHDCYPQLATMAFTSSAIAPIWQPSLREDMPDLLLGRPIIFTEYASTVGDVGDLMCVNWSQYLEGVLQPLASAESIHVRFVNHERAFKFWVRNAGAPWWNAALTPKVSSTTLSPIVTIAARA